MSFHLKNLIGAGAFLSTLFLGYGYFKSCHIVIDEYDVSSKKIPKEFNGMRILQISDLHNTKFGSNNSFLLNAIYSAEPDIIIMTGDMADRHRKGYSNFISLCKKLRRKGYRIFYTIGNHELYYLDSELSRLFAILRDIGVIILNNEKVSLIRKGKSIDLYGMWYGLHFYRTERYGYSTRKKFNVSEMNSLLGTHKSKNYSILMTHNPLDFKTYAEWGADLTFTGHMHGGGIRVPVLGGVLSPERRLFPKYTSGEYAIDSSKMIVNRGLGGFRFIEGNLAVAVLNSKNPCGK